MPVRVAEVHAAAAVVAVDLTLDAEPWVCPEVLPGGPNTAEDLVVPPEPISWDANGP